MGAAYDTIALGPAEGSEAFAALRWRVLGDPRGAEVFQWSYRAPPGGPAAGLFVRMASAPEPVGWIGIQPRSLYLAGRRLGAALLFNLMVTEEHRTVRPALALVRRARALGLERFDLLFGYPNRAALGVFQRAGYRVVGPMQRYACVLRHEDPLEKRGVPRGLAAVAGRGVDTVASLPRRARWRGLSSSLALEWSASADARLDRLWLGCPASRHIVGWRGAGFLQWRYLANPTEPHRLALLCGRDGEVIGYATVLLDGSRAHLGDLFAPDEHLGPLLDGLLVELDRQRVSVVDVAYLGRRRVLDALEGRGFRRREELRTVVVDVSPQAGLDPAAVADPECWQLLPGDGDL